MLDIYVEHGQSSKTCTYVKMLPSRQKSELQPALDALIATLPLLPHQTDIRLFTHMS